MDPDQIDEWSRVTADGSRATLAFAPLPTVWDEVQSDHGNCLGTIREIGLVRIGTGGEIIENITKKRTIKSG